MCNEKLVTKHFGKVIQVIRKENQELADIILKYFDEVVPDYFWTIPASSTGKYHPSFDLDRGGLVRHTKMTLLVAEELLELEQYCHLNRIQVYTALMLHDTIKNGTHGSRYTVRNHAEQAAIAFCSLAKQYLGSVDDAGG